MAAGLPEVSDQHDTGCFVEGEHPSRPATAGLGITGSDHQVGLCKHRQALNDGRSSNPEVICQFVASGRLTRPDQR
jgi:hypothetical protein